MSPRYAHLQPTDMMIMFNPLTNDTVSIFAGRSDEKSSHIDPVYDEPQIERYMYTSPAAFDSSLVKFTLPGEYSAVSSNIEDATAQVKTWLVNKMNIDKDMIVGLRLSSGRP